MASKSWTIYRYYLFRAANPFGFIAPVLIIYLLFKDLSYSQIGTLAAFSAILVVASEVPTGYIGDRIGRLNSVILSRVFIILSLSMFVISNKFLDFIIVYVFWSVAQAFQSGSASAWLYDMLQSELDSDSFTRVKGRGGAVGQVSTAVAMIAGGILYVFNPSFPFVAAMAVTLLSILILLSLSTEGEYRSNDEETITIIQAIPIVRQSISKPPVRSAVLYIALFLGVTQTAGEYIQPITVSVLETQLRSTVWSSYGLPEEALLGFLFATFALISAVGSYYADDVKEVFGIEWAIVAIPVITAIFLFVPSIIHLVAIPSFLLMRSSRVLLTPIFQQYINDNIDSIGRATVLSTASMIYSLVRAPIMVFAGIIADLTTPFITLGFLSTLFLFGAFLKLTFGTSLSSTERNVISES